MSEKAPYLTGSVKKIWMIAKDRAGCFSMAGVSFRDLLILLNSEHFMGFSYISESFRTSPQNPIPITVLLCHPAGQSPWWRQKIQQLYVLSLPKNVQNIQGPDWKLYWRSQHIEVAKVYFGCKIYYLAFWRDMFWHRDGWWFNFRALISSI